MTYFISMDNKMEEEKLKNKINQIDKYAKIYIDDEIDNDIDYKIIDSDIIICNRNKEKIKRLKKYGKPFFVYMLNNEEELLEDSAMLNISIKEKSEKKNSDVKNKIILTTSILIFLIAVFTIGTKIYQRVQLDRKKQEIVQKQQFKKVIEQKKNDIKKENYVFLGDSITEIYHLNEYYSNIPYVNSGVSSYTTDDILKNMEDFVYIYNPTKVILLIGTNDVEEKKYNNEELVSQIKKIINLIQKNRSKAEIYVESIYPVNNNENEKKVDLKMVGTRTNERIIEINKLIKKMCSEENVNYINMYDELTDKDGNFNIEYTYDGLHPTSKGYDVITKKLKSVLNIE